MIKNIRSSLVIKKIFYNINNEKRIKIIHHNIRLQNYLNVDIMTYRIFSGKYIIYETKIKGKEYDAYNDNLIYDGEYLNGKRNGIGKEYNENGKLIYEGEYLNGKKIGKGKIYDINGNLIIFEGEYINGEINGKGKIYDENDKLIFEGGYLNGKKNGKCKEYDENNKLIYEGDYLNGKKKWER